MRPRSAGWGEEMPQCKCNQYNWYECAWVPLCVHECVLAWLRVHCGFRWEMQEKTRKERKSAGHSTVEHPVVKTDEVLVSTHVIIENTPWPTFYLLYLKNTVGVATEPYLNWGNFMPNSIWLVQRLKPFKSGLLTALTTIQKEVIKLLDL